MDCKIETKIVVLRILNATAFLASTFRRRQGYSRRGCCDDGGGGGGGSTNCCPYCCCGSHCVCIDTDDEFPVTNSGEAVGLGNLFVVGIAIDIATGDIGTTSNCLRQVGK